MLKSSILSLNTSKNPWIEISHDFARHFDLALHWGRSNDHANVILELRRLLGMFYFFAGQAQEANLDSKYWIANRWHSSAQYLTEALQRHEIANPRFTTTVQTLADEHFTRLSSSEIHDHFRSSMYDFFTVLSVLDIEQAIEQGPTKW